MSDFDFAIKGILPTSSSSSAVELKYDGKDITESFAKLLISQISNQDPDSPMDPTAIVSQYATMMSSIGMARMVNDSDHWEQVRIAAGLVNKTVDYKDLGGSIANGTVTAADFSSNTPTLEIDGSSIPVANILKSY